MATVSDEQYSFKNTIAKLKSVSENAELDSTSKHNMFTQIFRNYFESEDVVDVFEGFLRLLTITYDYATAISEYKNTSLAVQCMQMYNDFLEQKDFYDRDTITESMPEEKGVYLKALKVASIFKPKYLPKIANVFNLKAQKNSQILQKLVKHIMKRDLPRSIDWIAYFDLRDAFETSFKEIVCQLFLLNLPTVLENFVGEQRYRKLNLIAYFDELFQLDLKKFKGRNESEEYALSETKRLEKFATKYMKLYEIPETSAPNILIFRTRGALLYHHYRWVENEMTIQNFEEIALHAMNESPFIRRFYLDFLCTHELPYYAAYFAFRMGMVESEFPTRLTSYAQENVDDFRKAKEEAEKDIKAKEKVMEEENNQDCTLPNGFPVHYVVDWRGMRRVMDMIKDEELIGIDTEWKPHYAYFKEQVALIQIACSKAIFLIDVVILEKRISNEEWLEFFTAVLCSPNSRKIGFDFANDLRVLKSTFPFLSMIAPDTKYIVCLYRLLQQVIITPKAEAVVFPDAKLSNVRLYDVAKLFMDIELDKSEQNSNWVERPMRYEKKVYAAQDAYCLTGCFRIIAERLLLLKDEEIIKELQEASIVTFVEMRHPFKSKKMLNPDTGEYEILGNSKKLKENDSEFIESVLKVTQELEAAAAARSQFKTDFKSINDFSFVMDSMLFGLGAKLRKCGFNTQMISDRDELLKFCKENPEFTAVSTGKAFKKLELYMPPERVLNVPINTNDPKLNSQLVAYIMRKLNIVIHATDLHSRCEKCNKRAFVRLSRHVVKAIFYLSAVEKNLDFLEISMSDLQVVFADLLARATVSDITPDMLSEENDEYTVEIKGNQLACRCRHCSVDVMNKLLLSDAEMAPIDLGNTMSIPRAVFDDVSSSYYACGACGKIHFIWPNQTAWEAQENAVQEKLKDNNVDGDVKTHESALPPTISTAAEVSGIRVKVIDT